MKLKEYRKKTGMTQQQVSKALGLTQNAYGHYETGRSEPNIDVLIALSKLFHTTIDSLIGNEIPYLLDKSTLTPKQKNLVNIVCQLDDRLCDLTEAYIYGKLEGQEEHQANIEKLKQKFK